MNSWRSTTRALRAFGCVLLVQAMAASRAETLHAQPPALDALVADVCHRQLVLLGEDANHGSGATLALKVDLVQRLVTECNYSAVLFESQLYDFLDLQLAIAARTATPDQVRSVIGGLWSKARETATLAEFLHGRAMEGRLTLGGLDPQVGGATQRYSQQRLPAALAAYLSEPRAQACETEIARLTNYRYDDSISYDSATRARLRRCVTEIQGGIASRSTAPAAREAAVMATNLLHYLDMSDGDAFNVRDRAMFENLRWHLSQLPAGARVIVWCATVHATKSPRQGTTEMPLGTLVHDAFGDRAAAIGFSALAGSYGRPGRPAAVLDTAPPSSLEGRALAGFDGDARFLDRRALAAFGTVVGRALNYRKPEPADWATLLDGVVVLREERPQRD